MHTRAKPFGDGEPVKVKKKYQLKFIKIAVLAPTLHTMCHSYAFSHAVRSNMQSLFQLILDRVRQIFFHSLTRTTYSFDENMRELHVRKLR